MNSMREATSVHELTGMAAWPQVLREADPVANAGRKEVVFIDTSVAHYQTLVDGVKAGVEVVLLDGSADGLAQMAAWAQGKSGYDAIHLLSHGAPGMVRLGAFDLNQATQDERAGELAALGAALNEEGDLLLYGCAIAAGDNGQQFISGLASITGATVTASMDQTGGASLGGNWNLERSTGALGAALFGTAISFADYDALLTASYSKPSTTGFPAPAASARVLVGDFDGDGYTDILYQHGGAGTTIYYSHNNQNSTFTTVVANTAGSPFSGLTIPDFTTATTFVGDYNNDGKSDLWIAANNTTGTLVLSGSNGYSMPSTAGFPTPAAAGRIVAGDFDADGYTDFIYQNGAAGSSFYYSHNNHDNTFTTVAASAVGSPFSGVTFPDILTSTSYIGDFNGDGKADMLLATSNNQAKIVLSGTSGYTIPTIASAPTIGASARIAVVDFSGGGYSDILYQTGGSGTAINYVKNNADGTFAAPIASTAGGSPFSAITLPDLLSAGTFVGDYNNDGVLDFWETVNNSTGVLVSSTGTVPHLTSSTPTAGNATFAVGGDIVLNFDQAIFFGNGDIKIKEFNTGNTVETINSSTTSLFSGNGTTSLTIHTNGNLSAETKYYIEFGKNSLHAGDGTIFGLVDLSLKTRTGIYNPSFLSFTTSTGPTAPTVTLSVDNASVAEAAGTSTITATLSAVAAADTTVTIGRKSTSTATQADDFTLSSATITILAGNTTGTATLSAVQDALDEADETAIIEITGVSGGGGATESGTQEATVTITDDDATPTLSIADVSQAEGNSGTSTMTFTVSLSAASGRAVTLDYTTSNGTATASSDYTAASGTLSFAAGETTKTFTVDIAGDTTTESDEAFTVTLSNASNATISDATATGTITNDEAPTSAAITSATYDASTGVLTITGTDLTNGGSVDESKLTLTGEGGATYTLTETGAISASSATSISITLNATDQAAIHQILNKAGTASTGGTAFNIAAAADWHGTGNADLTGNVLNVSNVAVPTLTSATYNASTGVLAVTGTGLLKRSGATNDIDVSK
ncbi:DUF4347 domain-containing protein, partial [Giesbergeria anulus]